MTADTATRADRFKQSQVLLLAVAGLSIFVAGLTRLSPSNPSFSSTETSIASEDAVDAALQKAASDALGQREGTIIVMDPQSGRVRAIVNPAMAFSQAFAPGSTIKPFSVLAAMRSGVIDKDSEMLCREHYTHDDFKTTCSHPKDLPTLDPAGAIVYSCNYYFGKLGERLSEESFRATLSSFGFGRRTGINVEAEDTGSLARGKWRPQAALGEGGYTQVTPAQLLNAYSALVNGGRLFVPRIAKADVFHSSTGARIEIDDAHRAVMIAGMRGAVRFGTAQASGLSSLPLNVFGKTGTSTPFKGFRTQGWFVGFADDNETDETSPEHIRLAVLVFVKRSHGAEAAALARPIFEEFARIDKWAFRVPTSVGLSSGHQKDPTKVGTLNTHSPIRVHLVRENITLDLSLDDYELGVVATEGRMETEPEALKALAVAVRSYALKNQGRHEREGFDFCSTTHCQRFQLGRPNPGEDISYALPDGRATAPIDGQHYPIQVIAAVSATEGEVLLDDGGHIADSYFSASCGGATANLGTLWGGKTPAYLRGVHDEYCAAMPHSTWTDVIERGKLLDALRSDTRTAIGARLDNITVTRRDQTGRAEQILLEGEQRKVVRGWDFKIIVGRALGWNKIKSSRFAITRMGNDFVFRGSGFGHGLGLCQEGAHVMAQRGRNYRQILEHYFPWTKATRTSESAQDAQAAQAVRAAMPPHSAERLRLSDNSPLHNVAAPPPEQIQATWHADLIPAAQARLSPASFRRSDTRLNLASEHFRVTYPAAIGRRDAEVVLRTLEATRDDLMRRIATTLVAFAPLPTIEVYINDTTT